MVIITHSVGCRKCLQADSIKKSHTVIDATREDYKDLTEFELMETLEEWMLEEDYQCQFCGSQNFEIFDIEVGNKPIFNPDQLMERYQANDESLQIINITKRDSVLNLNPEGKVKKSFIRPAIQKIIELVYKRPSTDFLSQIKGRFSVCVTGNNNKIRIESYKSSGLTRDEIINKILDWTDEIGINIDIEKKNKNGNKSILDGKTFRGALFNSWFYAESLDTAKQKGYSYANACFEFKDDILIAHGTAHDESPRDFIDNNRDNDFKIDQEKGPFEINGKTVYYAKKC